MNQSSTEQLKKTPLNARHRAHGARMVPFGGWDMPVEYSGIVNEHLAVRTKAGLFDVSHMGEIEVAGKDALAAVQKISSNDAAKLSVGQAQYSALTTPEGTFVDDLLVYRLASDHYLLVVNAGKIEKKYKWIAEHTRDDRRRRRRQFELSICAARGAGSGRARNRSATDDRRSCVNQVLLVRARRSGGRAQHHLANRLHRRGWLRALHSAGIGRARVEYDSRDGRRGWHCAGRPRRTRHAASRSRDAPVRSGHRRNHHGARSRSRMDRRLEERRFHRQGRARRAEARGREPQARRIRDDGSRHRPPWLQGVCGRRAKVS